MQENPNRREEKLEAHDIHLGAPAGGARTERQHGKLYRWLDNFWYHHKWKTIAALVVILVLTICIVQQCTKPKKGDAGIVLAVSCSFTTDELGYKNIVNCLSSYLPSDFDGDGVKTLDIVQYPFYSPETMEKYQANGVTINPANNAQNRANFQQYLTLGQSAILMIDPYLFDELCESEHLADLTVKLGETPRGAICVENDQGESVVRGIRLGDTALYQDPDNIALQKLPADTVVCLLYKFQKVDAEEYAYWLSYFKALVGAAE